MPAIHHPQLDAIPLETVLSALADPIRLGIVRHLAEAPCSCQDVDVDAAKSNLSHHLKVLRQAGIIRQEPVGTRRVTSLRREELDAKFPGLIDAVLNAGCPGSP